MPNDEKDVPETGQTGQETVKGRKPYFEVASDGNGKWHWVYWSKNGRPLAINAVPYDRRNDLTSTIEIMQAEMKDALIVVAHS